MLPRRSKSRARALSSAGVGRTALTISKTAHPIVPDDANGCATTWSAATLSGGDGVHLSLEYEQTRRVASALRFIAGKARRVPRQEVAQFSILGVQAVVLRREL